MANTLRDFEQLKEKMKEKGCKLTPQRRSVLDTIIENEGRHLSAEEIYELVKRKCPEIGLATVYRTMQMFEEIGIVYKQNFEDGRSRYEICSGDDHQHHHLVCQVCNKVIEVNEDLLEQLEEQISKKYNFTITNHTVKFIGFCNDCKEC